MDRADTSRLTSNPTPDDSESELASYGGAIFAGSKHFTVAGGTFTSITKNYFKAPRVPADFRIFPLGDIDLQREIRLDRNSGVLSRPLGPQRIRKVYSAKVEGQNSNVTVALYQGDGAEKEWQRDMAKYRIIRHPNLVQVWGTASMGNIHATIFHDDLIPIGDLLDLYKDSPLATVYIHAYIATGQMVVNDYSKSTLRRDLGNQDCTCFIRRSTGQFCVDLILNNEAKPVWWFLAWNMLPPQGLEPLDTRNMETTAINFLPLDQYHWGCYFCFTNSRSSWGSTQIPVTFGTVYYISADDPVEFAYMPEAKLDWYEYYSNVSFNGQLREVMENGWTRFTSEVAADFKSDFVWLHFVEIGTALSQKWLSQANHIFNRLGISSNFENYVVVDDIEFHLTISQLTGDPPEGFLFLCPPEDFHIGDTLSFKWPDCPAYWTFDPSGTDRLSADEAVSFGFPTLGLSRTIRGQRWDANVYASLWRFHQAKGFDPDSQDVARHLGYSLYELSREFHSPFAHIDEEDSCEEDDAAAEELESIFESSNNAQHDLPLEEDSQQSSLNEETSVSNTSKFARDFVTAFIPHVHDTESEGMGFSPVLM